MGGLALSYSIFAALLSPADRDSIDQQQQLLRQNQQRESLERATPIVRPATPVLPAIPSGPCFNIHRIMLDGATLINNRQQQKLVQPWQDQ